MGSVATTLLNGRGYEVHAATGRPEQSERLRLLGASEIVARDELSREGRPLQKERWAGAIDTVGGRTLASVLSQVRYGGRVAACGLAGGSDLPTTVLPFILRGISLLGIDSVRAPHSLRDRAWACLADELDFAVLDSITTVEPMSAIGSLGKAILSGEIAGRVVIDVNN
ncbi:MULTISPECIES: zinc-binding dehydrogenase [unclassified Arthrobacter]|uniref:zinc-binding dehydrogenase n=1 Tax=unclassified Arthrobacter TaxID=235627 RepID=UPI0027D856AB|nr:MULTISPECIES: zinc-binding dehydrogenase [unclassified Arthrobacter]